MGVLAAALPYSACSGPRLGQPISGPGTSGSQASFCTASSPCAAGVSMCNFCTGTYCNFYICQRLTARGKRKDECSYNGEYLRLSLWQGERRIKHKEDEVEGSEGCCCATSVDC
jgi:hypothetical protein